MFLITNFTNRVTYTLYMQWTICQKLKIALSSDIKMGNLALTIQDMNTATVVWCVYEY